MNVVVLYESLTGNTRKAAELIGGTARALGAIRTVGGSTRGRREDVDALAASVLLQHWLDARRGSRSG